MNGGYWARFTSGRIDRRRLLKGGATVSAGAAALAVIGCGSDEDDTGSASPTQSAAGNPKPGGTFGSVVTSTSAHMNIFANFQEGYALSGMHVYDRPITRRLDSRRFVLEAAESIEQPNDLKVIIKLKPNMVFQNVAPVNGRAVKASDIVAVQDYVRTLAKAENPAFQKQYLERAEATDDRTVVYTLKSPFAYLFASTMLCNPTGQSIVPQELLAGNMEQQTPIGSGAYKAGEFTINTKYTYLKNETYHGAKNGLPYVDRREVLMLPDIVAAEAALRSEQVHMWRNVPPAVVERIARELGNKIVQEKYPSTALFITSMRMGKAPWTDIRVREAFYRLTNRQQFVDLVSQGNAVVPPGPLQTSLEEYQLNAKDTEKYFKNDVNEAKQLLRAANWDFDKEYEITINNNTSNNAGGEVWQQQLAAGGVKIRPVILPLAEWLPNRVGKGEFDLIISGLPGGDTPFGAMRNHHSDTLNVFNFVGLGDKDVDALIEKTEATVNREENIKLVKQLQLEVLKKYSGTINLQTVEWVELRSPKVENYEPDPLQGQVFKQNLWFNV